MSEPTHHTITATPTAAPQGHGQLLSTSLVAGMLGTSNRHVQMQAEEGRLPFSLTPGGHRRIAVADVVASVHRSGIPGFTAADSLLSLAAAASLCGTRTARFKEAADAVGVPLGRTLGAKQEARGHLRVMQRDIYRVRQQLLLPRHLGAPVSPTAAR
jgi:excisionase family DNA binding protein